MLVVNKKWHQVGSELAGSMYPGPNRHPVDPRSVSILLYILEIH